MMTAPVFPASLLRYCWSESRFVVAVLAVLLAAAVTVVGQSVVPAPDSVRVAEFVVVLLVVAGRVALAVSVVQCFPGLAEYGEDLLACVQRVFVMCLTVCGLGMDVKAACYEWTGLLQEREGHVH